MFAMVDIQRISATQARNDFFNLLKKSYLEKIPFLIEKGEIPMVYMIPINHSSMNKKNIFQNKAQEKLLYKLNKFKNSMKETSDSVILLREMRRNGR